MAQVTLKGNPVQVDGQLPQAGQQAPAFSLVAKDLSDVTLASLAGKRKVLNIFPSIDTPTCATSVRKFNAEASALPNTVVLCISADLPFAQARFCGAEGLDNVVNLSTMRGASFLKDYGVAGATLSLFGLDPEVLKPKLQADLKSARADAKRAEGKLSNEKFVNSAPEAVVNGERKKQADAEAKIAALEAQIAQLK